MLRAVAFIFLVLAPTMASAGPVQVCETTLIDPARGGRSIPLRIRMPAGTDHVPLILFSHGLGGTLDSGTDWVDAWAAAGFMTVNIQHIGSDSAVWKGQARPLLALLDAMDTPQLQAHADDVHVVLDRIAKAGRVNGCDLGRADMHEVGMSGHSFGAQTTLAVAGGNYAGTTAMRDTRIKAAIAFSPQPARGEADRSAFGGITMPFFTVTGTRDSFAQFGGTSASDRLRPYQAMPAGQKYLLVLDGATHMMLNGQTLRRPGSTPPPEMVDSIDVATVLFWRATLMHDQNAVARLKALNAHVPAGDQFAAK